MEPEKTDQNPTNNPNQDNLIKEAEAAAEQASETTEKIEEQHAEQPQPAQPLEPTAAAPVEQPQPAQPLEPTAAAPVEQPLIVPDSIVAPKKKKHPVRNAILIILGLLILGCAGVAIWFFAYYNNSEKVAADALQHLVTTDNVAISAHTKSNNDSEYLKSLDLNIITNRQLPATLSLDATINQNGRDTNLSAGLSFDRDGVIYAHINGLVEAFGLTDEVRQQARILGEDARIILNFIDDVETETWRIDIPEIVDEFNLDKEYSAAYTCLIDKAKQNNNSPVFVNTYKQYPFLNVKNASDNSLFHNSYDLTLDSAKLTNFINTVTNDPTTAQLRHCLDNLPGATVTNQISESEVESIVGELPVVNIKVDWLSHQLTALSVNDDIYSVTADITYPQQFNFNPPAEYRSATELLDEFTDVVNIYLGNYTTVTTTTTTTTTTTERK